MARRGFSLRRSAIVLRLDPYERAALRGFLGWLESLVEPEGSAQPMAGQADDPGETAGADLDESDPDQVDDQLDALSRLPDHVARPQDPILLRLLPDGYRDDPEAAAEFRRYTESDLRKEKASRARRARATLAAGDGLIALNNQDAFDWMLILNDLRLAFGTALGLTQTTGSDEVAATHPDRMDLLRYDWLTWLQSTCIDALASQQTRLR